MLHALVRPCCLMIGLAIGSSGLHAQTIDPTDRHLGPHVRSITPGGAAMLKRASRRSPTFAALVDALNRTDVIVYVQPSRSLPSGVDGGLTFIGYTAPLRYVRVEVRSDLGENALLAVAAHELQHALEVAAHAEVRDRETFNALYGRIGVATSRRGCVDTPAAVQAGRKVRGELT